MKETSRENVIAIYRYCAELLNAKAQEVERNKDYWEEKYISCSFSMEIQADLYLCQMKLADKHLQYYKDALNTIAEEIEKLEKADEEPDTETLQAQNT